MLITFNLLAILYDKALDSRTLIILSMRYVKCYG